MPEPKNYKISFIHQGQEREIYLTSMDCHDAYKWRYIADSLGISYCSSDGRVMLSHAIKNLVEAKGVSQVVVQTMPESSDH
ncbi:hypothetical protein [Pseudomonas sp. PAMC 26793]|jgi:hypothetical protein|uniref:hypothetical protein n=1 Tax=Pseudomonas sp. PAMC 26793 TaxID=1240676 RepID=UPI0003749322|nr:hypothetical protein [Pseudomonas sp. PAMC 26793]